VSEAFDYADQSGILESIEVVPYRLEPAIYDVVEQSDLIVRYRACIHQTVHLSYGSACEQAEAQFVPQNQIVMFHTRRKTEKFWSWMDQGR